MRDVDLLIDLFQQAFGAATAEDIDAVNYTDRMFKAMARQAAEERMRAGGPPAENLSRIEENENNIRPEASTRAQRAFGTSPEAGEELFDTVLADAKLTVMAASEGIPRGAVPSARSGASDSSATSGQTGRRLPTREQVAAIGLTLSELLAGVDAGLARLPRNHAAALGNISLHLTFEYRPFDILMSHVRIEEHIRDKESLERRTFVKVPLPPRFSLEGKRFNGSEFVLQDFSRVSLARARFVGARFYQPIFAGAVIDHTVFDQALLQGTSFRDCTERTLRNVHFRGAELNGCAFDDLRIERGDFTGARARACSMKNVQLIATDCTFTKFGGTTFAGALLERCVLDYAEFVRCYLAGARFIGDPSTGRPVRFAEFTRMREEGELEGTEFRDLHLVACDFSQSDLTRATFTNCVLTRCNFSEAVIGPSTLSPNCRVEHPVTSPHTEGREHLARASAN